MDNLWETLEGFTDPQKTIFRCPKRFRVAVCGRRFGKTTESGNELTYEAQVGFDKEVWYIAPTYAMAKDLMWEPLKKSIPSHMIKTKHESDLSITLKGFNSTITLKGADKPDRLRGKGLDFVVMDEYADIKPETWFEVIYPALTDKQGAALFIGTPKGFNWAYDLAMYADDPSNEDWEYFSYTTAQGGNVPLSEIEYAKNTLSKKQFDQEFNASFESLSNLVYSAFDRHRNTCDSVQDDGSEIYVGMDFNVSPMSAVIGNKVADQLHIFDEIEIENGNTAEMCQEIKTRYPDRKIIVCPDPSGKARKTSAPVGTTDFTIIANDFKFKIMSPNKAPLVVDRVNEVNALCENVNGIRRLFISKKCKNVIKCLSGLTYKTGTSIPDKSLGLDHMTDALGYLIHMLFPINIRKLSTPKLIGL